MKTAIHEAGHAVACYRLMPGRYTGDLTIVANEEEGYAGAHETLESWDDNSEAAKQEVLHVCAGYAACVAAGFDDVTARLGCSHDFERAEEIITRWNLLPLDDHLRQAIDLMRQTLNLRAVKRLADELTVWKTLDGDEITVLIDVADEDTPEAEAELIIYRAMQKVQRAQK